MSESLSTYLHATVIYQPHIAQTWFVIAIIVSGAKYAVKISPSTSDTKKYISAFSSDLFWVTSNILGGHSAMNGSLFNRKVD